MKLIGAVSTALMWQEQSAAGGSPSSGSFSAVLSLVFCHRAPPGILGCSYAAHAGPYEVTEENRRNSAYAGAAEVATERD